MPPQISGERGSEGEADIDASVPRVSAPKTPASLHVAEKRWRATDGEAAWHLATSLTLFVLNVAAHRRFKCDALFAVVQLACNLRFFMIFHDCGHKSFFRSARLNWLVHHLTSPLCFTPTIWSKRHAVHHVVSGRIDNKQDYEWNDTILFTVEELKKQPRHVQILHSIIRWPPIFFSLVPLIVWFIFFRMPFDPGYWFSKSDEQKAAENIVTATRSAEAQTTGSQSPSKDVSGKKCALGRGVGARKKQKAAAVSMGKSDTGLGSTVNGGTSNNINTVLTLVLLFGVLERVSPGVAWPWFLGTWGSMCVGFMLFHTQHANNPSFACRGNEWSAKGSALRGSSHLTVVPRWLRWVTMGIEYHHIHHLTTRIPGYRLRECHEALPANQWAQEGVLSLDWSGVWMSLGYTLFNEKLGRFV